jgi:S1-C subfamily serine protease
MDPAGTQVDTPPHRRGGGRFPWRYMFIFSASTVLAFAILVRTELISDFAYLIEKGRIKAIRESMPTPSEVGGWNAQARSVAAAVTPGVVQIVTEQRVSAEDIHAALRGLLGESPKGSSESPTASPGTDLSGEIGTAGLDSLPRIRTGYGSGFITDAERGYVVTNEHVIEDADAILVFLSDGRRYTATLLGADARADLAVLRIDAPRLHALPLADGEDVEVGDDVMAVGNPFGLDGTFSRGIVSAKERSRIAIHGIEYQGFIQTDAVINPGNSGGPLVNLRGEVVAINTAIATESGHYDGVGFAIPARRIKQLLPALIRGGRPVRGYLGVSIVSVDDFEDRAEKLGWQEYQGVIIDEVLPNSPAARGGLQRDDIVIRIGKEKLRSTADLIDTVSDTEPDHAIELLVWRDRKEQIVQLKVGKQPDEFSTHRLRR